MISKAATLSKKNVVRPTTLLPKQPRSSKMRYSWFLLTKLLGRNSISGFLYALFSVMILPSLWIFLGQNNPQGLLCKDGSQVHLVQQINFLKYKNQYEKKMSSICITKIIFRSN